MEVKVEVQPDYAYADIYGRLVYGKSKEEVEEVLKALGFALKERE